MVYGFALLTKIRLPVLISELFLITFSTVATLLLEFVSDVIEGEELGVFLFLSFLPEAALLRAVAISMIISINIAETAIIRSYLTLYFLLILI